MCVRRGVIHESGIKVTFWNEHNLHTYTVP